MLCKNKLNCRSFKAAKTIPICYRLNCDLPKDRLDPNNVNVTRFGNNVFANVINMKSYWMGVGPKSNDWYPYRRPWERQKHAEAMATEAELEEPGYKPRNSKACSNHLPYSLGKRAPPLLLERLASRTEKHINSVVLST